MSSQGLERRFLCGRQKQGRVIGARFLVTARRLSSAVSRCQRREASKLACPPVASLLLFFLCEWWHMLTRHKWLWLVASLVAAPIVVVAYYLVVHRKELRAT